MPLEYFPSESLDLGVIRKKNKQNYNFDIIMFCHSHFKPRVFYISALSHSQWCHWIILSLYYNNSHVFLRDEILMNQNNGRHECNFAYYIENMCILTLMKHYTFNVFFSSNHLIVLINKHHKNNYFYFLR
jgi:hypothetical protein